MVKVIDLGYLWYQPLVRVRFNIIDLEYLGYQPSGRVKVKVIDLGCLQCFTFSLHPSVL